MKEYIERDAFLAEKRKQYCADCDRRKGMKRGKLVFCYEIGEAPCRACYVDDLLTDVEDAPAAEVMEVKHGQWVNIVHATVDTTGYCDKCHSQSVWRTRDRAYESCPRCGAKMDGYHNWLKQEVESDG